ncbi:hypothetical protein FRACA_3990002 [Frankia canadensis]|uniref:Carrier domain-containing protein n=2 Tax=Frankia canadensis TaxID=1836972 RepID=A0A2I2KWB5_9ACTN|nr:hypothetical protein FRACA_3990002 [Frankia canadensis]SOU57263.1 hypothetical protein FRACA_3990002 [Frankia canadensis]
MTEQMGEVDRSRLARIGVGALSTEKGLALFDAALERSEAHLVPMTLAAAGTSPSAAVPPIARSLFATPARKADERDGPAPSTLSDRLVALAPADRRRTVLDAVRAQTAQILGHSGASAVPPGAAFKELGFDSLTSLELRNRLDGIVRHRLPVTLVFDHPTPEAIASYLLDELFPQDEEPAGAPDSTDGTSDAELRRILATIPIDRLRASGLAQLLLDVTQSTDAPDQPESAETIDELDTERLILMAFEETD